MIGDCSILEKQSNNKQQVTYDTDKEAWTWKNDFSGGSISSISVMTQ